MTRRGRIIRNIAAGLAAFVILAVIAVIWIVQTAWFRDYVSQKIVTETQNAIGGRVEVGSIAFNWKRLEATVDRFVIHGTEPASAAPFVNVARVIVDLRLFTNLHRLLDISFLELDQPQVNVIVNADGSTNIPIAPRKTQNNSTPLQTLVDLAIGRFELKDGVIHYNSHPQLLNVQGNNLHVRLGYHTLKQDYEGNLSFQPVYIAAGRKTPVTVSLNVPLTLERDRISVQDATIVTPRSALTVTASVEHLHQPKTSARVLGHVALADVSDLGNLSLAVPPQSNLSELMVDANADIGQDTIRVSNLHLGLGNSSVDAKGTLEEPGDGGALDFTSNLNLAELSRLAKLQQTPSGTVALDGKAKLGNDLIEMNPFRLRGFGGEIQGSASLEQMARYQVAARLSGFDLQQIQKIAGRIPLPYSGSLGGSVEAKGDTRSSAQTQASAALTIAPRRTGIPVSGNVNASYDGVSGDLRAGNSTLKLPHTSVSFSGSLHGGLKLDLITRDLQDLRAADPNANVPVKLNGGQAELQAVATGTIHNPAVRGHLSATHLSVQDRRFDSFSADFDANKARASVANGMINRNTMRTQFAGSLGLVNWSPPPMAPLSVKATVNGGDLADILALAGQKSAGYSGALTASADVGGTLANPAGTANIQVANGTIQDEMFDQAQAQVNFADQRVRLPGAFIASGPMRADLSADYQHARDNFTNGRLTAHLNSTAIDLAQIHTVESKYPNTQGTIQIDASVEGQSQQQAGKAAFQFTSLMADVSAQRVRFQGQNYGDLMAKATTSANTVAYTLMSDLAGSQIRATGQTQLTAEYPTNLDATLSNLPVERVLAIAKRPDVPAKGVLAGNLHFSGTAKNPQGRADLSLTNAVLYNEPIDRVQLRADYLPQSINLSQLQIAAGASRLNFSARFDHPVGDLNQGGLQFEIQQSRIDLARLRNLQERRPGLGGSVQVSASGKAEVRPPGADITRIAVQELNARVAANGLTAQGKNLGNLNLTANTSGGRLNFALNSNFANSSIQGSGNAQLSGDFPATAQLTFNDVTWANLHPLLSGGEASSVDGSTSGSVALNGPLSKPEQINATLRLTTLQVKAAKARAIAGQPVLFQNQGDIAIRLANGQVNIDSAHLTGPQTDVNATGSASIRGKTLNIKLNANADLALLQAMDRDAVSSGTVSVAATAQGTFAKPLVTGRVELRNAAVSYANVPLGFANANAVIALNGNTAIIQNFTADSGGGKITLTGFATRENLLRFAVKANAQRVRVHVQQGVDVVATANLDLSGNSDNSLASGTVRINRVSYLPQTDIASILTRAAPPVQSESAASPILANMKLDILVRSSSATGITASAAQNVQILSDLRIRGTAARPGATGTVQMTEGKLAFFGSTYTISTGLISFYNPSQIEPILNLTLETQAQGVTVSLTVTGPVDNLKLSYTSDPPLQFQEIIALLAAGQTPTSDPTLLANQPSQPSQTFQERGESALLGTAVANPVANRLQRVFGVSQLKIDPSFSSGSALPQARMTLQQQVTPQLVFTYVTNLDNANSTEVRAQWSMNPQWSAIANRDENGLVSINLQYKREFR